MFFEIDDPVIRSYDFLENVGTLYDLLINLLNENETILDSSAMQLDLTRIMKILQTKAKNKKKKEIFAAPSSVLSNLSELFKKRGDIINQFAKGKIINAPKKITESVTEKE